MSDLQQQFEEAVQYVQSGQGNFKPDNDLKLQFYALYKQATEGDVKGKKPGLTDFVGRAKFNAWEKLKGQSAEQAMQGYIDKLSPYR